MRPSPRAPPARRGVLLLAPGILAMLAFVVLPLAWIVRISFYEAVEGAYMRPGWTLAHYRRFLGDGFYLVDVLWFSVEIAVLTTALAALLAYPLALYIARSSGRWKNLLY